MATEIRFVQQVQDPDAEAHAARGVAPDGVFIRAADGTEEDATQLVNAVIEIQQQSQGGSTFLLGHELAHNLLDVLRRTGTLTPEMDTALAERFKDKDGAFDEEAFADAFGAELRDAFTLQEEERIANTPKTKVGRILRAFADTVRGWAYAAFAFRRAKENAQVAQANAPASVLEAFMQRQGGVAASGAQQNQGTAGTAETVNRSESPNSSPQGAKYHVPPPADENIAIANEGVTEETFTASLDKMLQERVAKGNVADNDGLRDAALEFYREFHDKKVQLSDGRFVYFVPLVNEARGLSRDEAWAEYAIHSVTNDRTRKDGAHERAFNPAKASALKDIERILKEENVFVSLNDNTLEKDSIIFVGSTETGRRIEVVTRLDEFGNVTADLTEVTVVTRDRGKKNPPTIPLSAAVEKVAQHQGAGFSPSTDENSKAIPNTDVKYHIPGYEWVTKRGRGWDAERGMSRNASSAYDEGRKPRDEWTREDFADAAMRLGNEGLASLIKSNRIPISLLRSRYLISLDGEWHHVGDAGTAKAFYALLGDREAFDERYGVPEGEDLVFMKEDSAERLLDWARFDKEENRLRREKDKAWKAYKEGKGTLEASNEAYLAWAKHANNPPKYHIPNPTERFSETGEGKRVVAEVLDALIETNPVFVFDRERAVDGEANASEGKKKQLDETLKRLDGIKEGLTAEQWQDVLGTAFEVSERFDVLGETNGVISPVVRERMAAYLQDIVRNRATMLGRRAYMAGRNFAWRRAREEHSEVLRSLAEKRAKERKGLREDIARLEGDLKGIGREYRELETQAEGLQARVNYLSDVIDALNADKADLRERMREAVRAERVRQARKDAVRREVVKETLRELRPRIPVVDSGGLRLLTGEAPYLTPRYSASRSEGLRIPFCRSGAFGECACGGVPSAPFTCVGLGKGGHEPAEQEHGEQGKAALGEEGQGDARHRQRFGHAADVQKDLHAEHGRNARPQKSERWVFGRGAGSCRPHHPEPVEPQQEGTAHQAPFFGHGGIDEIAGDDGHRTWRPLSQTRAPQAAGILRAEALPDLPALPQRILEGVQPHVEPRPRVRRDQPHRPAGQRRRPHAEDQPARAARQGREHQHEREAKDQHQPEIPHGHRPQQRRAPCHRQGQRVAQRRQRHAADRPRQAFRPGGQPSRREHHQEEFHQLRGIDLTGQEEAAAVVAPEEEEHAQRPQRRQPQSPPQARKPPRQHPRREPPFPEEKPGQPGQERGIGPPRRP